MIQELTVLNYLTTPRQELLDAIARRDGFKCRYCVEPLNEIEDSKWQVTVDHYHSIDFGKQAGWNAEQIHGIDNLVLAHKSCNAAKGNRRWMSDGTLEPKPSQRVPKAARPDECDTCANGRLLLAGEHCPDCESGPQPATAPKYLQRPPKECDHDKYHCAYCFIGLIPRVSSLEVLISGHRADK